MRSGSYLWLSSYPKSGNTWLRLFLAAYVNGGRVNINALPFSLSLGDTAAYLFQSVSPIPISTLDHFGLAMLRGAVLLSLAAMDKPPVLLKTHAPNRKLNEYPLIPAGSTSGAIYLVRDPRDVAVSMARHTGQSIDEAIEFMGHEGAILQGDNVTVSSALGEYSAHVKSWTEDYKFPTCVARYEDMIADPVKEFTDILTFMEWDVDEAMVKECVKQTSLARLKKQEKKDGFREATKHSSFFNKGQAGGWRDVLTEDQVRIIERNHGDVMDKFGYERASEVVEAAE